MNMQRGFRDKIDKYADPNNEIVVEMKVNGNSEYDYCCFGVDENGKLSDDRYMVFYNQTNSPANEITYTADGNGAKFAINLNKLPASINKLVFTVSIDGNGTMGSIISHTVSLKQNQNVFADLSLAGTDFHSEKAIIAIEIYKKDVWRIAVVASGFNGGLGDLLREYGGEEDSSASAAPTQQAGPVQSPQQPAGPMQSPQQPAGPVQSPQQPSGPVQSPQQPAGPMQPSGPMQSPVQPSGPMQSPQQPSGPMQSPQQPSGPMQSPVQPAGPMQSPMQPSGPIQSPQQPSYNPSAPQQPFNPYAAQQPNGPMQSPQQPGFNQPQAFAQGNQASRADSLEVKLQKDAPKLVSLAKPLKVELTKRNLQNEIARVALVIDISGSMTARYANGTVQDIVNRTLPLAVQFDDDGELDFWYYGSRCKRMPSVNMHNYQTAVPADWKTLMKDLGYGNNEPVVMKEVIKEFKKSNVPSYVVFITDGGVGSESSISHLMKEASKYPIFWQFVGVGGSGYGVLERLDDMGGRYVDNADFFALDDFKSVSDSDLYSRLLNEFPSWLQAARGKGII
ncbi:MAG: VWA domain-containing protein [Eubacterium sp.]|nr:VWA domain-containing protein [Eubacterium sp.]